MNIRTVSIFMIFAALLTAKVKADVTYTSNYTINISAFSVIRIYPVKTISMTLGINNAGESLDNRPDETTYLQLTSVTPLNQTSRITASMSGTLPTATLLELSAQTSTTGSGDFGAPSSSITLSSTTQTLINTIGSAYTGTSSTSGYKLTYLFMPDPANIRRIYRTSPMSVTITFTIISN